MTICYHFAVDDRELHTLLDQLRATAGDTAAIEVKSAAGGLPRSLPATLSALANKPGGGIIILGIDERTGFLPVGLTASQAHTLSQGLASQARTLTPHVQLSVSTHTINSSAVVVASISECPTIHKPCTLPGGKGYVRAHDGDYEISDLERQGFFTQRTASKADHQGMTGCTINDLDTDILERWISSVRSHDTRGLGRFSDDNELLRRAGVLAANHEPTKAAMLAMGVYPQQYLPNFVIRLAWHNNENNSGTLHDTRVLTGPIPTMLEDAIDWARDVFPTSIIRTPDGSVHNQPLYPLSAFRELVSNALIHRDLEAWSEGIAVDVRANRRRLVITNPGGLYGITVSSLKHVHTSTSRNTRLVALCQHLTTPKDGNRVVEALATGMRIVFNAATQAQLPQPEFIDNAIRFTVIQRTETRLSTRSLSGTHTAVLDNAGDVPRTLAQLGEHIPVGYETVRRAVRDLVRIGLLEQHGGKGRKTTYTRSVTEL